MFSLWIDKRRGNVHHFNFYLSSELKEFDHNATFLWNLFWVLLIAFSSILCTRWLELTTVRNPIKEYLSGWKKKQLGSFLKTVLYTSFQYFLYFMIIWASTKCWEFKTISWISNICVACSYFLEEHLQLLRCSCLCSLWPHSLLTQLEVTQ